ncbi:hypothetical protein RXV86_12875 [Alisedimentitalea sp. MJ-SS2]|uniref:tetratricopeptide repeat protein n=1 Tax=Aliisedimentitalea sp. MJ-SS2 TaxID=3049795 RepID=UPI00290B18D6|nr:hypothetical protein [Alisedimentitalea sp. MJ-SS2]MDU8928282.1 hypothetical protein [Alisedimentitalea sp. MJ-SS2]
MRPFIALVCFISLASCENVSWAELTGFGDSPASAKDTSNLSYYPDDDLLVSAKVQFKEGNYGKSFRMFKSALDVTPKDPAALLGFAASADMLRKFDHSDFAYRSLKPIIGGRIEYLNNYGYSMLLRGELVQARTYFLKAYEKDPSNPVTANNLELLRNSVNYPKRGPGQLKGI